VKGSAVAEFRRLWGLQGEYKKKERVNHIHHCIDAITIACMTKNKYDLLAHYYLADEKGNKELLHKKLKELKPWNTFTEDVKAVENEVLVSHHTPDKVPKQTKKKLRKRGKIQYNKEGKPIYQRGDTARGSLHKETFYGAIKPKRGEKEKYVLRKSLDLLKQSDIKNIVDDIVREKIQKAVAKHGFKEVLSGKVTVWMNEAKKIPIIKVRCYTPTVTDPIHLKPHRDQSIHDYKQYYYVANDTNYLMAIYEGKDNKGKTKRDFELVNLLEATEQLKLGNGREADNNLYPEKKFKNYGKPNEYILPKLTRNGKDIVYKIGNLVLLCENNKLKVNWNDQTELQKRLYKIRGLSHQTQKNSYGVIKLMHHQEARQASELKLQDGRFELGDGKMFRKLLHTQMDALVEGIDFTISTTGKIKHVKIHSQTYPVL